jgi:hypothetical protein
MGFPNLMQQSYTNVIQAIFQSSQSGRFSIFQIIYCNIQVSTMNLLDTTNFDLEFVIFDQILNYLYRVFHRFRQAKFDNGGSILSSSQFLLLPQLPQKMKLASKVVKIDSK